MQILERLFRVGSKQEINLIGSILALLEREVISREVMVIRPLGSFDPDYFKGFETKILKSLDRGITTYIVNWLRVEELTIPGLHLLLLLIELIRNKHGKVIFCSVSERVQKVMDLGNAKVPTYSDEYQAISANVQY